VKARPIPTAVAVAGNDWGFPIVNSRPIENDSLMHLARRAVATCPRLALLLAEEDPNQ